MANSLHDNQVLKIKSPNFENKGLLIWLFVGQTIANDLSCHNIRNLQQGWQTKN